MATAPRNSCGWPAARRPFCRGATCCTRGRSPSTELAAVTAERVAYLAGRFRVDPAEVAAEFAERDACLARPPRFRDGGAVVRARPLRPAPARPGPGFLRRRSTARRPRSGPGRRFSRQPDAGHHPRLRRAGARRHGGRPEAGRRRLGRPRRADAGAHRRPPGPAGRRRCRSCRPALQRFLEELPAPGSGLGRTEQTMLAAIAHGASRPAKPLPSGDRRGGGRLHGRLERLPPARRPRLLRRAADRRPAPTPRPSSTASASATPNWN